MLIPEQVDPAIRDYVIHEYHRGLTPEGCIGLHGTSLEAIQYLLAKGVLPGGIKNHRMDEEPGEVFYTPLEHAGTISPVDMQMGTWYAKKNGARHFLSTQLGLDLSKPQSHAIVNSLVNHTSVPFSDDSKFQKLFATKGWDHSKMQNLVELAEEQMGIIIGIRTQVGNKYQISDTDRLGGHNDGPRIITKGKGLPFTDLVGILPLGNRERQFFNSL